MAFWSGLVSGIFGLRRPPPKSDPTPLPRPRPATEPRLDAPAYFERATLALREGQIEKALADFSRAIELDPKYSQAYASRGVALERAGRPEDARKDYAKSIEIDLMGALKSEYGYGA